MKNFTREQINKIIEKATEEIAKQTHENYLTAIDKLSDELKNLALNEVAIAIAQGNAIAVMKEVVIELLSES